MPGCRLAFVYVLLPRVFVSLVFVHLLFVLHRDVRTLTTALRVWTVTFTKLWLNRWNTCACVCLRNKGTLKQLKTEQCVHKHIHTLTHHTTRTHRRTFWLSRTGSVMDKQASWRMAVGPEQIAALRCFPSSSDLRSSNLLHDHWPASKFSTRTFSFFCFQILKWKRGWHWISIYWAVLTLGSTYCKMKQEHMRCYKKDQETVESGTIGKMYFLFFLYWNFKKSYSTMSLILIKKFLMNALNKMRSEN